MVIRGLLWQGEMRGRVLVPHFLYLEDLGHWPRWGLGTPLLSCDLQAEGPGDGEGRHPLPQGEGSGGGAGQCLDQVGWLAFIDLQPHHKVWATEDTCQSLERAEELDVTAGGS